MAEQQPDATVNVIKGGENAAYIDLYRSPAGLALEVKTHAAIEDFFRGLGDGQIQGADAWGRAWFPVSSEPGAQLSVYNLAPATALDLRNQSKEAGWRVDAPGRPLILEGEDRPGQRLVNLSFLRIPNISHGAGVRFGIRGVYSREELNRISDELTVGVRKFYQQYLKTVNIAIVVSTQEMVGV